MIDKEKIIVQIPMKDYEKMVEELELLKSKVPVVKIEKQGYYFKDPALINNSQFMAKMPFSGGRNYLEIDTIKGTADDEWLKPVLQHQEQILYSIREELQKFETIK